MAWEGREMLQKEEEIELSGIEPIVACSLSIRNNGYSSQMRTGTAEREIPREAF